MLWNGFQPTSNQFKPVQHGEIANVFLLVVFQMNFTMLYNFGWISELHNMVKLSFPFGSLPTEFHHAGQFWLDFRIAQHCEIVNIFLLVVFQLNFTMLYNFGWISELHSMVKLQNVFILVLFHMNFTMLKTDTLFLNSDSLLKNSDSLLQNSDSLF